LLEAPISAEYDFLSVLIPRVGNGDYSEIKQYLSCEFSKGDCVIKANSAN
jgi:hypothetical protein